MPEALVELAAQVAKAVAYYLLLVSLMRMAGKRLAGQTTTFDLIVLISLGVVLQTTTLQEGTLNAFVFVATVFATHRGLATLCARNRWVRHLVRGKPRVLVRNGKVLDLALDRENISVEELLAGLRKLGHDRIDAVRLAVLEETGHISAVAYDDPAHVESRGVVDRRDV
ncbi:MAG TPA: YetF domain-containing protein [Burkholderiaceae bacterium]|nr:YetF domain-containing protein [Burkholderiaceae bacterium]